MSINWLSVMSNVVMAAIWAIYLHFFYSNYKRANRPFMIIHQANGTGLASVCMFVNMSKEPIHVQSLVAYIHSDDGVRSKFITDYDRHSPEDESAAQTLREGPIQPGGYLILGTFRDIIEYEGGADRSDAGDTRNKELEICVAVTHGPSQHHIGARRRFNIQPKHNGQSQLQAQSIYTEQLVTRRKRHDVQRWIEERLKPERGGDEQDHDAEQKAD